MIKQKYFLVIVLFLALILNFIFVLSAYAVDCVDQDGDGYIVIDTGAISVDGYNADGNYSQDQWNVYFDAYKKLGGCDGLNFKKGAEPARCDAVMINNKSVAQNSVAGKNVHPGAVDGPNNGIDEDCDGADGQYIQGGGTATDIEGLFTKVINILGYYVVGGVSAIVLLWGGITYATAAGDDTKLSKARKAMIGAIIGLIIGIAAPSIINFVITKLLG